MTDRPQSPPRVPDLLLERYRLGEMTPDEGAAFERRLHGDEELRQRLRALEASDEEIRRRYPADVLCAQVRRRLLARYRAATLAVDAFASGAVLRDEFRRLAFDDLRADAGVALAVYLRRVALPVLQLYAAYGFSTGRVLPGFSLGFGF